MRRLLDLQSACLLDLRDNCLFDYLLYPIRLPTQPPVYLLFACQLDLQVNIRDQWLPALLLNSLLDL